VQYLQHSTKEVISLSLSFNMMSERGGRGTGRGGRGNSERERGRGRGQDYSGARGASKSGLCAALGNTVFDYGHKAAADQMRTSMEKIVLQYVGTNYGQAICNELRNKITVILPEPVHAHYCHLGEARYQIDHDPDRVKERARRPRRGTKGS
jgi:hypothetical protein